MGEKRRYRAVFLSDLHLGCAESRADEAAAYLKTVECDHLYLVGDVIDMWCLRKRWHWPESHNRFVRRVLKMAKRGTRVVFIPGNHDEPARRYAGLSFGGVRVALRAVHRTADGRALLVVHGDEFDMVVRHAPLLSALGGRAYDWLLRLNRRYNRVRAFFGRDYWSLSRAVKLRVKSACTFISRFEEAMLADARAAGVDGVVCGHIHKAEHARRGGLEYLNCGDWLEGGSVVVEHEHGALEVIDVCTARAPSRPALDDHDGDDAGLGDWAEPEPLRLEAA